MFKFNLCLSMRRRLLVFFAMPLAIYSQSTEYNSQTELIRALRERIDQLERRMAQMEDAVARPKPETKPETVRQTPQIAEHAMRTDTALSGESTYPSLKIAGFGDFNFAATDQHGAKSGFTEGQFGLHLNSNLSPKVTFLGELSLTARTDAGTGSPPATGFNVEVERSIIRFEQNDYFKISFGRYHTPINYWNMTFHHGQWLQTTISRPEMVQFGGSFLPIHFVGALVEGAVPAGGLNLNYNLGIGNGRSSVISKAGDWGDVNNNRAWLATVFSRPDRLYGLQVGASVYRDLITPIGGKAFREWIESAHVVWSKGSPELIAEFANVTHQEVGTTLQSNSQAWYVQAAYRLPWLERLVKPYYRF